MQGCQQFDLAFAQLTLGIRQDFCGYTGVMPECGYDEPFPM